MTRTTTVRKSTLTNLELAQTIRERDQDLKDNGPTTTRTALGIWQFGPGGTSTTTHDTVPHRITSKEKYRR